MDNRPDTERVWRVFLDMHEELYPGIVVTRQNLTVGTGLDDRVVREAIHELVCEHGKPIISLQTGGYKVAGSQQEIEQACGYYHRYAMQLLERETALRKSWAAWAQAEQIQLGVRG